MYRVTGPDPDDPAWYARGMASPPPALTTLPVPLAPPPPPLPARTKSIAWRSAQARSVAELGVSSIAHVDIDPDVDSGKSLE